MALFTLFHQEDRKLSIELDKRVSPGLRSKLDHRSLDLSRPDEELVLQALTSVVHEAPGLAGPFSKIGPRPFSNDWRDGTSVTLVVDLEGDLTLVEFWPDESGEAAGLARDIPASRSSLDAPAPRWRLVGTTLQFTYVALYPEEGDSLPDIASVFDAEIERVTTIIDAIGIQVRAHQGKVKDWVSERIAQKRVDYQSAVARFEAVQLPSYKPLSITVTTPEPESVGESKSDIKSLTLPPQMTVLDGDWHQFVRVVQRWASTAERLSPSFSQLDEYELRDLLLGTLQTVYPVAHGEVMTAGQRSDIFVVPDPGQAELRPILAELKMWSGESKVVDDIAQHLGQLTVRDTRGTLIYFVRAKGLSLIERKIHAAIERSPGFEGWDEEAIVGTWPAANITSPEDGELRVTVNIGTVHLQSKGSPARKAKKTQRLDG